MHHKKWTYLILGLGVTGVSCARFLSKINASFAMADSRETVQGLDAYKAEFPKNDIYLGDWSLTLLQQAEYLVISPGIALSEKTITQALASGVKVTSDIELFLNHIDKPTMAVTGSNGKSTVVTLLGEIAKQAGLHVPVAGNIGLPVLDLLQESAREDSTVDAYVLELSSFQLERLGSVDFNCACILNISEDHMDRYESLDAYVQAKHKIYNNAAICVSNRDDVYTACQKEDESVQCLSFGLSKAATRTDFGILQQDGDWHLQQGDQRLMSAREVLLPGKHNLSNALAAMAIVFAMRWPMDAAIEALKVFPGLAHRCQFVAHIDEVEYINDSKGTNVGATLAAIEGLCSLENRKAVLILGGEGKGADFSSLKPALQKYGRAVICIGKEAPALIQLLAKSIVCKQASSMSDAVNQATQHAQKNDYVLLSPACASFDMFDNFEHRGQVFSDAVCDMQSNYLKQQHQGMNHV